MYTVANYVARNGLSLDSVVVALTSLTINKSDTTNYHLKNGALRKTVNPNTQINCSFGVFKDAKAVDEGLEPIEALGYANQNFNPDLEHDTKWFFSFSFSDHENLTEEAIMEKAYQVAQERAGLVFEEVVNG